LGDAQEIPAEDAPNLILGIISLEKGLGHLGQSLRREVLTFLYCSRVPFRIPFRVGQELSVHLFQKIDVIRADPDVLGAHQLGHVVNVADEVLGRGLVITEKMAHPIDADKTALPGTGLDLVVAEVAGMFSHGVGIGMGEDDGILWASTRDIPLPTTKWPGPWQS